MNDEAPFLRPIRSFVKREGKLTKGQYAAIERLWATHGVDLLDGELELSSLFARHAPTVVEIGFGNGSSLASMAQNDPDTNFLGIEVHTPGVGSLLVQVDKLGLTNVRVSKDDATLVFEQQIADASIDRVQVFFPDPWHKKRHHKRRLIQPPFIQTMVKKLKVGATIHLATDWQHYAEHMLEVLNANNKLVNTAKDYAPKPDYRPTTKYEQRGQRLNHGVWDLVFTVTA